MTHKTAKFLSSLSFIALLTCTNNKIPINNEPDNTEVLLGGPYNDKPIDSPVINIPDYFSVTFKNETDNQYSDDKIFIHFVGLNGPALPGKILSVVTVKLTGETSEEGSIASQIKAAPNSFIAAIKLSDLKNHTLYLPQQSSNNDENGKYYGSRIYISFDTPLKSLIVSPDGRGFSQPTFSNNDTELNTLFDWLEFTYDPFNSGDSSNPTTFGGNTTQVDQFSIPLWMQVHGDKGYISDKVGIILRNNDISPLFITSRSEIIQGYLNKVSSGFKTLIQGNNNSQPTRIISPVKGQYFSEAGSNYFSTYINEVWSFYKTTPLKFCDVYYPDAVIKHTGNCFNGLVNAQDQLEFYKIDSTQDCTQTNPCKIQKPTTHDVFTNGGPLALAGDNHINHNAFGAQLAAALNRHVVTALYDDGYAHWIDKDFTHYYPNIPANEYAEYWHTVGIKNLAYGMGYDDIGGTGPLVYVNTPGEKLSNFTIGIGW